MALLTGSVRQCFGDLHSIRWRHFVVKGRSTARIWAQHNQDRIAATTRRRRHLIKTRGVFDQDKNRQCTPVHGREDASEASARRRLLNEYQKFLTASSLPACPPSTDARQSSAR